MSLVAVEKSYLDATANAIRSKTNSNKTYKLSQFAGAINNISGGSESEGNNIYTVTLTTSNMYRIDWETYEETIMDSFQAEMGTSVYINVTGENLSVVGDNSGAEYEVIHNDHTIYYFYMPNENVTQYADL